MANKTKITSIRLSEDTKYKLNKLKLTYRFKSTEKLIQAILSIVTKLKLGIELKNEKH
jgi:hypothetical protein